jgi:SAM-dependent methyltransferase
MIAKISATENRPLSWDGAGSQTTRCVWCGAHLDGGETRLRGRVRCPNCGAASTDPWPSAEELDLAYGTWYRPEVGRRFALIGDAVLNRTRALIARRIDEIAPPGPVIDVGSGEGVLLDALRCRGRGVLGLERDRRGPDVRDASLAEIEGDGEWAAVVFWHSLEHLPEPGDAIAQAGRLLRSGGVVLVAVPDTGSIQAGVFGDNWLHLDLPRHLVHLSAGSLRSGLERKGFRVERVSQVRGAQIVIGWLDGLVGSLPGELRLYESLRRSEARSYELSARQRAGAVAAAVILLPVALACSAVEVALGRSGTVYMEARIG